MRYYSKNFKRRLSVNLKECTSRKEVMLDLLESGCAVRRTYRSRITLWGGWVYRGKETLPDTDHHLIGQMIRMYYRSEAK